MPTFTQSVKTRAGKQNDPVDPFTGFLSFARALGTLSFDATGSLVKDTNKQSVDPPPPRAGVIVASEGLTEQSQLAQQQAAQAALNNTPQLAPAQAPEGPAPAPPQMSALWNADP